MTIPNSAPQRNLQNLVKICSTDFEKNAPEGLALTFFIYIRDDFYSVCLACAPKVLFYTTVSLDFANNIQLNCIETHN